MAGVKCTIGKDGRKYFFKNGKRFKPITAQDKSECEAAEKCVIGKDAKAYHFKGGKRISKAAANKNVACVKPKVDKHVVQFVPGIERILRNLEKRKEAHKPTVAKKVSPKKPAAKITKKKVAAKKSPPKKVTKPKSPKKVKVDEDDDFMKTIQYPKTPGLKPAKQADDDDFMKTIQYPKTPSQKSKKLDYDDDFMKTMEYPKTPQGKKFLDGTFYIYEVESVEYPVKDGSIFMLGMGGQYQKEFLPVQFVGKYQGNINDYKQTIAPKVSKLPEGFLVYTSSKQVADAIDSFIGSYQSWYAADWKKFFYEGGHQAFKNDIYRI